MGTKKFKRLVLNPEVFESYGHLEWANIKTVTVAELQAFSTADAVRADGDDKVYKLFPNGDSGTKRWVESLDCFNSNNYDWDSVYVINSVDRDNYTTGSSMCGGGDVVGGDVTLSLASTNPAASTVPPNAQGVTFLDVDITGTGTVNQLTFKRNGAGATADFGDLYIYRDGVRLTSGRALSSSTSKVTFINLGLQAPTSFQLTADMSSGTAGNINYFTIEASSDVTGTGSIGGVFPMNGNPMGISGTNAGTVTVTRSGAASRNVTIGATEVEISQFKLAIATEGANVHWVELFNNGTADNAKITNLKLKDNTGATVATATSIGDDGYVTFVFDTPYYIKKGDSEIFRVYANIGAVKPDRTILLYNELATSVFAKGTTYGFGMAATVTSFDGSSADEYVTITCKGGDLTLNKVGPNATVIGTKTHLKTVIEELYELNVLHIEEHTKDESLDIGEPLFESEKLSEILIKLNALLGLLNLDSQSATLQKQFALGEVTKKVQEIIETANALKKQIDFSENAIKRLTDVLEKLDILKKAGLSPSDLDKLSNAQVYLGIAKDESIRQELRKLKNTEYIFKRIISLPIYPKLSLNDSQYIVSAIKYLIKINKK